LDFGLGFGLCFRSNQWTFIRFLVELKVLSQLSKLGWRLRLWLNSFSFRGKWVFVKHGLKKKKIYVCCIRSNPHKTKISFYP
jgi:hypothetical protein